MKRSGRTRKSFGDLTLPVMTAIPAAILAFLFVVARRLSVDYYDGYGVLLNARHTACLSGGEAYNVLRGIASSVLFAPAFVVENLLSRPGAGFIAAHLLAVGFLCFLLYALYRLFRLSLARRAALLGVLLFSLNPLIIHAAPFAKEDIPGTLFSVLAFYFYLRAGRGSKPSKRPGCYALSGLAIFAAISLRYNLVPAFFSVLFLEEFLSGRTRLSRSFKHLPPFLEGHHTLLKIFSLFLLPAALFFILPSALFFAIGRCGAPEAPGLFLSDLRSNFNNNVGVFESPAELITFLWLSVTPPILLAAVLGFISQWKNDPPSSRLFTLWLGIFFFLQGFVIGHKESRYLFPLLAPLYYFAACGIIGVLNTVPGPKSAKKSPGLLRTAAAVLFLAWPSFLAVKECVHFADPVYSSGFQRNLSLTADRLAGNRRVFWIGHYYSLRPKKHIFHRQDEYTYFYHTHAKIIEFFTGRRALGRVRMKLVPVSRADPPDVLALNTASFAGDGDVLIINPDPMPYSALNSPERLRPLQIVRIKRFDFRNRRAAADAGWSFASKELPGARIVMRGNKNGILFQGAGIPPGVYDLSLGFRGSAPQKSAAVITAAEDGFDLRHAHGLAPEEITSLSLLRYDHRQSVSSE